MKNALVFAVYFASRRVIVLGGRQPAVVLFLAKNYDANQRDALMRVLKSEEFIIEPCNYSYEELDTVMNTINDYIISNPDDSLVKNVACYSLSDDKNVISVELLDYSEESVAAFKDTIIDGSMLSFTAGAEVELAADLQCGDLVTGSANGSVGYRAKMGSTTGIVTSGHVAGAKGTSFRIGSTTIGTASKSQTSGSIFVQITNSSYIPTNKVRGYTYELSTSTVAPPVGSTIYLVGYR